jgi:hypothetical protein
MGHGPHSSKIFVFYVLFVICRSVYYLCVNVYCTTATGWLPNCIWQIYIISYHIIYHVTWYHVVISYIMYHIIYHIYHTIYHIYHIIYYTSYVICHVISFITYIISYHVLCKIEVRLNILLNFFLFIRYMKYSCWSSWHRRTLFLCLTVKPKELHSLPCMCQWNNGELQLWSPSLNRDSNHEPSYHEEILC